MSDKLNELQYKLEEHDRKRKEREEKEALERRLAELKEEPSNERLHTNQDVKTPPPVTLFEKIKRAIKRLLLYMGIIFAGLIIAMITAKDKKPERRNSSQSYADLELINLCGDLAKARLNYPSTFKSKWFSGEIKEGLGGEHLVYAYFTASNAFGAESSFTARCHLKEGKISFGALIPD